MASLRTELEVSSDFENTIGNRYAYEISLKQSNSIRIYTIRNDLVAKVHHDSEIVSIK
jgi:hypothetical protein